MFPVTVTMFYIWKPLSKSICDCESDMHDNMAQRLHLTSLYLKQNQQDHFHENYFYLKSSA